MVGTAQHSVVHVLGDHLQVVWGALLAFVIVVLLTPAVGGMARILGVVDAPGGRRVNRLPVPRLGGIALFLGIFVPALAFLPFSREPRGPPLGAALPALLTRQPGGAARSGDRRDGWGDRRLPRPPLVGEARRPGARRGST